VNWFTCSRINPAWAEKIYRAAGLTLVGDDIKSQSVTLSFNRVLAHLLDETRLPAGGATLPANVGGNTDFLT